MDWGQGPPQGPGWDGPPPPSPGWGNPGDVEYVEEQRPGSKMANALPMCCLGILLWPVSLCLLGWNEVNYVCKHKSILYGQKMAEVIGCEPRSNWYQDMVVYMSCPIHEESLQVFTPASFGARGLQDAISFRSASGSQYAEMYQCVETSRTEKTNNGEKIRIYSYHMEWESHPVDSSSFSFNGQAQSARDQGCPYFRQGGNPAWPSDLPQSSSQNFAQAIRAGPLSINHQLITGGEFSSGLPANQPVKLGSFAQRFGPFQALPPRPPQGGFVSITPNAAAIDPTGMYITTCSQVALGCLRISYKQSAAKSVSVLSGVEGGYTKPVEVPSSWGCSAGQFEALLGKPMSIKDFTAYWEEMNSTTTWIIRILGLCFVAITIYCCFAPISAAADVIGDLIGCLPCVGDFLEDLLEGMVDTLLWIVSCALGCSCGLLVISLTWLVMRPLIGGGLLLVCLVLGCCAFAIAHQHKANRDAARSFDGDDVELRGKLAANSDESE